MAQGSHIEGAEAAVPHPNDFPLPPLARLAYPQRLPARCILAMTANELRIVLIVLGAIVLVAIYWFGRPQSVRSRRAARDARREPVLETEQEEDGEPHFTAVDPDDPWHAAPVAEAPLAEVIGFDEREDVRLPESTLGQREDEDHERIVSLYVVAQDGYTLQGPEIVIAAEKAGMVHGDLGIFHRLADGRHESRPIFSMANMLRPGSFDLAQIDQLSTPGVVLFMTLPGPLSALDAWDTLLPSAQRFADLLNAQLLDDQRTPIGRQRIAALRDELRAWDRRREQQQIRPGW